MLCTNYNNQPNFKSTIQLVNPDTYLRAINKIYYDSNVLFPWTIKESKLAKDVYTRKIYDCTAVGITNGLTSFLMHICPTEPANFDFAPIKEYLLKKIDFLRNDYIQGFILGGKTNPKISPRSIEFFDNFVDILKKEGIPYSKFKGGIYENDIAYITEKDTWFISNEYFERYKKDIKPMDAIKVFFDDVEICPLDELSW
ncbi:hypothetical protein J6S88_05995 [bacterium]|nr:hypothetical protein [bacterium]